MLKKKGPLLCNIRQEMELFFVLHLLLHKYGIPKKKKKLIQKQIKPNLTKKETHSKSSFQLTEFKNTNSYQNYPPPKKTPKNKSFIYK